MATKITKTLDEVGGPLPYGQALSETLMPSPIDDRVGSRSQPLGSSTGEHQENGAADSAGGHEGLKGDVSFGGDGEVVRVKTRIVQTKITVEASFEDLNGRVLEHDGGFAGDAEVNGGSSSLRSPMKYKAMNSGGNELVKGWKCVYESEKDVRNVLSESEDISDRNGKGSGDDKKEKESRSPLVENGEGTAEEPEKVEVFDSEESEDSGSGEKAWKPDIDLNGEQYEEERKDGVETDREDDEGEDKNVASDEEEEYFKGDFVWGKIRSHPWWPGRIYDPSDASVFAKKLKSMGQFVVAYFGDGSFSWCSSSQLQHMEEDFEAMLKQSSSKNFVNAVQQALDEVSRLVKWKMTCSCICNERLVEIDRQCVQNAGIKQGVLVPEDGISRLMSAQCEPNELLATIGSIAKVASATSKLELAVITGWLSAFNQAKGGYQLAMYHEPLEIEGLEDKNRNGEVVISKFNVPAEIVVEEVLPSSTLESGYDQTNQPLLQKCLVSSDDKLHQRRKKKSVAELLKEAKSVEADSDQSLLKKSKPRKRRTSSEEAASGSGDYLSSPSEGKRTRKKMAEISETWKSVENDMSTVENGDKITNKEKDSSVDNDGNDDEENAEIIQTPRERKKSKYLSPPYTNPTLSVRDSSSKRDSKLESVGTAQLPSMKERTMRVVAGKLSGSLTDARGVLKENSAEELSAELDVRVNTPVTSVPQPLIDLKKTLQQPLDANASSKEVLFALQSAALNPICRKERKPFDMTRAFLCSFRDAIYLNGPNYKEYRQSQRGRKRKSEISGAGLQGKKLNQSDDMASKSEREPTGNKKGHHIESATPMLTYGHGEPSMKTSNKDTNGEAYKPSILIVTFPPGFPLPSKDKLVTMFSKFGALNERLTDVSYNSYCARISFLDGSDAQEAFNICIKKSLFGAANVNYRLRYSSSPRGGGVNQKTSSIPEAAVKNLEEQKPYSPPRNGGKTTPISLASTVDDGTSRFLFIKQKLEIMTSMLEKWDGSIMVEMKQNLENELKGLLEKVSNFAESSTIMIS